MDVISLTQKLIAFDTVNPPGNEAPAAEFAGELLAAGGFSVALAGFGENRKHLIAEKGIPKGGKPVVLSGHFDVVPLGSGKWKEDPFNSHIKGDKLYGRGSSDMKGGLAAMMVAVSEISEDLFPECGVRLVFTAGEELGCQGAADLVTNHDGLGQASAIIIGEPTANIPAAGHKGAVYLEASASGKTAHSSMPELGVNAVYKAARAVLKAEKFSFNAEKDALLGYPTINVGKFNGGLNLNSVPDHAEFTIDLRTTSRVDHGRIIDRLGEELGKDITLKVNVNLPAVYTARDDEFVQMACRICESEGVRHSGPAALPYLTDGSVLQSFYRGVPTIILGPGYPEMAHRTDEFCDVSKILQAVEIYRKILISWKNPSG